MISNDEIKAVACEDEDRLFRDVTQIQMNIFIEACRASEVLVITPSMVYDFANPVTGIFHMRQFRFKCELAAEYINTFIKGKLHRAKRRLALEGRWFGGRLPPGYMIDTRKKLPDGSKNQNWRRYVPFKPYAEVVVDYFQIFLAKAGNVHGTLREIHENGPYYPDPRICLPPSGFRIVYPFHRYDNGYCPGETGLVHLLTNAVYLGHWMVDDVVVIYDNHPPIVPEDIFWRAFNYLSQVTLDGRPNADYKPFREYARHALEENRSNDRPLCSGMIIWEADGEWFNLGIVWIGAKERYDYRAYDNVPYNSVKWSRAASYVDDAVSSLTLEKLAATFDSDVWEDTVSTFGQNFKRQRKRIKSQLVSLERVMKNLVASLENLSNPDMIAGVERRYEHAQVEHHRLQTQLHDADAEIKSLEAIKSLRENYQPALQNWDRLSRDEKRAILQAFILQIEATPIDDNGLRLVIYWRDQSHDELLLASQTDIAQDWLNDEIEQLLSMVDRNASQIEIAQLFPERTWEAIRHRVWKSRGAGGLNYDDKPIKDYETFEDYQQRIREATFERAGSGDQWTQDSERVLLELLDNGATQVDLAKAFPDRRWWRIRWKITQLRGKGIRIPGVGEIKRNETFVDYLDRTGQPTDEYTVSVQDSTSPLDYRDGSHAPAP